MKLSDGERLILIMLSEIHEKLKIENGVDTALVKSAIYHGNLWALERQFVGIFHKYEARPEVVSEAVEILDMWRFIETSYRNASVEGKAKIKTEAAPFGEKVRFRGFDGNGESEYISVASCMIDDLDQFELFKGRDMNSHLPSLDMHRRMLAVFKPMRTSADLTISELIKVLKEQMHPENRKAVGASRI